MSDNANDFLEVALTSFDFLTQTGNYSVANQHVSSTSDMGTLVFESPVLHILFGRESGRFFLDIAAALHSSDPDDWYDLPLIRRFFECASDAPFEGSPYSFAASLPFASANSAAEELRYYLSEIEHVFAPERICDTKSSLDAIRSLRNQATISCFNDTSNNDDRPSG